MWEPITQEEFESTRQEALNRPHIMKVRDLNSLHVQQILCHDEQGELQEVVFINEKTKRILILR